MNANMLIDYLPAACFALAAALLLVGITWRHGYERGRRECTGPWDATTVQITDQAEEIAELRRHNHYLSGVSYRIFQRIKRMQGELRECRRAVDDDGEGWKLR